MGQQPNIEIHMEDLPRPTAHPAAPRRWSPTRPGELGAPDDVPWGGLFGTPGPDAGYALRLLAGRVVPGEGERRHDVEAAMAALMVARASHFGRAPIMEDAEMAELILGYETEDIPDEVIAALADARKAMLPGIAHHSAGLLRLVAAVDVDVLTGSVDAARRRMTGGGHLLGGR